MKNNYKVYVHISPNGKRYYGTTKKEKVEERWRNGRGYYNNEYFTKAINKYGWDNFEHIVIAKGLTKDEAKWVKMELIREWDTINPEYGYNESRKKPLSEETKQKMSESHKGYKHTEKTKKKMSEVRKGMQFNEEHKNNLSKANKGKPKTEEHRNKIGESNKGKAQTDETKEKISKKNKGRAYKKQTRVYCVELDRYFETVREASEYIGRNRCSLSNTLAGRNKTCGGYHWMYAEDVENNGVS